MAKEKFRRRRIGVIGASITVLLVIATGVGIGVAAATSARHGVQAPQHGGGGDATTSTSIGATSTTTPSTTVPTTSTDVTSTTVSTTSTTTPQDPCSDAPIPLIYPSYTGVGSNPTGPFLALQLDCTPPVATQTSQPPAAFLVQSLIEDGQLISSTEYQFVIAGLQAVLPTTEQPPSGGQTSFTIAGSSLALAGDDPTNEINTVTLTEEQVPAPDSSDESVGVQITLSFYDAVTGCNPYGAGGAGDYYVEVDCAGT